jgi:translation initiation factor 2B subunit (eIF-2B alpha/beta/delta family)
MENIEQRITQVRNDRDHGSRWLVREAITILYDLATGQSTSVDEQMRQLYTAGKKLAHARPSMAALPNAVGRILNVQGGTAAVAREAALLLHEYDTATEHITAHATPFMKGRLMTCSLSGTVLDVLLACRATITEVVVLEGRPRYEGRAMATALSKQGMAVTLITDAQADILLPQCTGIVVGADSVLANGDVLNKAGTALLAWAAHGHNVPFYVLCETLKISPRRWSENEEEGWSDNLNLLEEKEPEEVLEQPISGVKVRNFYFDHTANKLVTKLITERGILGPQAIQAIADRAMQNERAFEGGRAL